MVMARRRRGNSQLAVRPFDVDGVRAVAIGTVLWAVAFIVLAFFREELDDVGMGWWLWTCLAGVGMGLLGLEYTRKRRDAIAHARLREEADRHDDLALVEPDQVNLAELPESEPVEAGAEQEPVRAAPEGPGAKPTPVHARSEPVHAKSEPVPAKPEPVPAEPAPIQAEKAPIQAEPEPVQAKAEYPPTRPEPQIAQWTEPGLLDIGPPLLSPAPAGRRARRAASDAEQIEYDDDEPLLPMATDPRGRRSQRDDSTDEFDVDDGDPFYRGRRARRP
jgi:hypothetical protein